jgi:predicted nucleic acid-binding Zn ribbon protein
MPTYVYETIPAAGGRAKRFEVSQRMSEAPLTTHPETGEPVRRVISGGLGVLSASRGVAAKNAGEQPAHQHGPGCGHSH